MLAAFALDLLHERAEPVEVGAYLDELAVDECLGALQLVRAHPPLPCEHLLVHLHEMVDGGVHRRVALAGWRRADAGRCAMPACDHDDERADRRGDDEQPQDHQYSVHLPCSVRSCPLIERYDRGVTLIPGPE